MNTFTKTEAFTVNHGCSPAEARRWGYDVTDLTPSRLAVAASAEVSPVVVVSDERELSLNVARRAMTLACGEGNVN